MESGNREYQKAIDYIYGQIKNGKLSIGSRLPTERSIAQTLSISRNSAREALRMLDNMGMLESRQGSGNYLVDNLSKTLASMIDIMMLLKQTDKNEICLFRRTLEKGVCLAILEKGTIAKYYTALNEALNEEESSSNTDEQIDADQRFHLTLVAATENRLWTNVADAIMSVYRKWIESVLKNADSATKALLNAAHRGILTALKNGNRIECEKYIDEHYSIVDKELIKENRGCNE